MTRLCVSLASGPISCLIHPSALIAEVLTIIRQAMPSSSHLVWADAPAVALSWLCQASQRSSQAWAVAVPGVTASRRSPCPQRVSPWCWPGARAWRGNGNATAAAQATPWSGCRAGGAWSIMKVNHPGKDVVLDHPKKPWAHLGPPLVPLFGEARGPRLILTKATPAVPGSH